MIEAYAFLAVFTVQVLVMSVLHPAWFIKYFRAKATRLPAERLAQLYPGVDFNLARERFLTRLPRGEHGHRSARRVAAGLAVQLHAAPGLGRRHGEGPRHCVFLAADVAALFALSGSESGSTRCTSSRCSEGKRTAVLQRRGLFDFVSPFTVFLAVVSYFLFVAFVLYVERHPFPGYAGAFFKIGGVTVAYALMALCVYAALYLTKKNPFETHADRMHTIETGVKFLLYTCLAAVVFVSLDLALGLLDLKSWELFAMSVFYVACGLLSLHSLTAPARQPDAEEFGSHSVR